MSSSSSDSGIEVDRQTLLDAQTDLKSQYRKNHEILMQYLETIDNLENLIRKYGPDLKDEGRWGRTTVSARLAGIRQGARETEAKENDILYRLERVEQELEHGYVHHDPRREQVNPPKRGYFRQTKPRATRAPRRR